MKKHMMTIVMVFLFVCGLALFLYPTVSNLWNERLNASLISEYVEKKEEITEEAHDQLLEDARTYNQYLHDEEKLEELGLSYENVLNLNGNGIMGYIEIPRISAELVIYHSLETDVLQDGIGHKENTALPVGGKGTHCVLAGHSGLPSAKLLTNLDQMELGDYFHIYVAKEKLTYRVDNIEVVLPWQMEKVAVESGRDLVTLVTCTPYGINTHRLLVRGNRVADEETVMGGMLYLPNEVTWMEPIYLVPLGMALLFFSVAVGRGLKRLKRRKHGETVHAKKTKKVE